MTLHDYAIVGTALAIVATMWVGVAEQAHGTLLSLCVVAAGVICLFFSRMWEQIPRPTHPPILSGSERKRG